jgi:hypothetical protein
LRSTKKRTCATPIQTYFHQAWGQLLVITVTRPCVTDYAVNARYTNSKRKEAKEIFRSLLAVCTEARFGLNQHVTWGTETKSDKKKIPGRHRESSGMILAQNTISQLVSNNCVYILVHSRGVPTMQKENTKHCGQQL